MAELTGQVIITTYGEQQLLSGTFTVTKIKLGSGIWTPTSTSQTLLTQEADLAASGAVIAEGAGGYRLHSAATDSSANAYDLHEFALTDNTDVALAIYSQAAIIAAKASGSQLLFSDDFVIDNAPPGSITITGPTTYDLPIASTIADGIIEIATDAEVLTATDTTRAITSKHGKDIELRTLASPLVPIAVINIDINSGAPFTVWSEGPAPSSYNLSSAGQGDASGMLRISWASPVVDSTSTSTVFANVSAPLEPFYSASATVENNNPTWVDVVVWNLDTGLIENMANESWNIHVALFGVAV